MFELLTFAFSLFIKYFLVFGLFFLTGRSFSIVLNKYFLRSDITNDILSTKITIFYPLIGLIIYGNGLILLNFFIGLQSPFLFFYSILLLLPNFIDFKKSSFQFLNLISLENFFLYIFIPSVLLVSSSDINFHYDAAYYHLNHQNWLRSSNLIIGTVNIFWPFGMSSIFEYLSSILWFQDSLIYLHFLKLIFSHFFFSFIFFHLFNSKSKNLKYASFFLILFAIFDNFGISGGRNGFIYIQEIGKQDTAVAILYCITSLLILDSIQQKKISKPDLTYLSLLVFFIYEIKVSGVIIFFLFFVLWYELIKNKILSFKEVILLQFPTIIFGIVWSIKSILTTGCLIFPLSFTCYEGFWWYEIGSTERVEAYTTATSFSYMEYFLSPELNFNNWVKDFFFSSSNSTFSNYYLSVYSNFLGSFIILFLLSLLLFNRKNVSVRFKTITTMYFLASISYLIFYGPIPRYSMGILCTTVCLFGFFVKKPKLNLSKNTLLTVFIIAIGLFPRISSYQNFLSYKEISLFDPRIETQYGEITTYENWIKPDTGDRCWINIKCTMESKNIKFNTEGFFKVAFKEN